MLDRLRILGSRIVGFFVGRRLDSDFERELDSHLAMLTDENIRRGMSPDDARRAARLRLGNPAQLRESHHDLRTLPFLESFIADIRYALRMLRKSPGFTVVIVLTLALGIGASTAVFSLLNAVIIRSLPYGDADRLVYIWLPFRDVPQIPLESLGPSNGDFLDIQRSTSSYSELTSFDDRSFSLAAGGTAIHVEGAHVTADFFTTLACSPEIGRAIGPEDLRKDHEHVVVISHGLWQAEFGGDLGVLTKTLRLDGETYEIIGVMPPAFHYPNSSELHYEFETDKIAQVWLPWVLNDQQASDHDAFDSTAVIGRMRPGVSVAQAQAEMNAIVPRLSQLHTQFPKEMYARVNPLVATSIGGARRLIVLLFGAVSLVLLIACVNAASLLLARAASRMHEIGVRAALGAGRTRIVRQMLTEAFLFACVAGVLGILLAGIAIRVLLSFDPGTIPRLGETSVDARVLVFSVGSALLTGILFGIFPAIAASRINPGELLKQSGNTGLAGASTRLRHSLIVLEVALAVVLVAGAGLLIRSYSRLSAVNTGFAQSALTMNLPLDARYGDTDQRREFFQNLLRKINELPGVEESGAVNYVPLSDAESFGSFRLEGYANKSNQVAESRDATEHYFEAMGTPLIEGRFFNEGDIADGPAVAIVNDVFAKQYFPGQSAVGKRICLCPPTSKVSRWSTIVGVVAGVRHLKLEDSPQPQVYTPFWQSEARYAYIAIRTAIPPAQMIPAVRNVLKGIDPMLAVTDIHTMEQRESVVTAPRRFQTFLLSVFAGSALLLAAIGLYGLIAYSVKQRTPEISVRVALGAQRRHILKMVLTQGMALALLGLVLGLAAAFGLTRLLSAMLYEITPNDPGTYLIVSLTLLAVSFVACWIPAWRATRVDPMVALRHE